MLTKPRQLSKRAAALALASLGLLASASTQAAEDVIEGSEGIVKPLRFSGFATLGLAHNNNATAGTITSFSQLKPVQQGPFHDLQRFLNLFRKIV
jgi:hypothetical protein